MTDRRILINTIGIKLFYFKRKSQLIFF